MNEELHIAGIVVRTPAEGVERVAATIADVAGARVHATSSDGKVVVTLEAPSAREITACIDDIRQLDMVLSASLVYQHNEALEAMMKEVSHEDHETGFR